jgi:hypothetical protein
MDRPAAAPVPADDRPPRRWVRWVLFAVCLPIVAMWVYAYGFATKKAAVHLDDTAWTERAENICAAANEQRDELFDARRIDDVGPDALLQRADIVDQATAIIERMLDEIVAVQPDSSADRQLVAQWEDYYRTLIEDRKAYTAGLRAGQPNRFDETVVDDQPLSSFLDDFARPNRMASCVSPKDLS